jgi:myosin heavy subunit
MAETFFVGQDVYAVLRQKGWASAKIAAIQHDGKIDVTDSATGEKVSALQPALVHGILPGAFNPDDADLFRVNDLHPATLLLCLKARYEGPQAVQYSRMGEMILSVNPFQRLAVNGEGERDKYLKAPDAAVLPPHVWQIADKAFKRIVASRLGNQSVVISGESGSGKTENTKALISYLGALSQRNSVNDLQREIVKTVNQRLADSNPILESFGNARTVRNDNSSRFGKYVKLYFDPHSGIMVGGGMETYLLEKSRVCRLGPGERCYHVFYEMLAGLPAAEKQRLGGLRNAQDYPSLARGNTLTRRGVDGRELNDADEFKVLVAAMTKLGMTAEVQSAMWTVLASILHLLDVEFGPDPNEKAMVKTEDRFRVACGLLSIDPEKLRPCFLVKSKTKILTTQCMPAEAEGLRDSFCKALYVGVFDHLVAAINRVIAPTVSVTDAKYIGILDIFGFENFQINSFEQMCINFANESLQNHYNKYTFLNDEEECRSEGIEFPKIEFPDNTECLNMFDLPKTGIFALLDEACYVKGGTYQTFTENVWAQWTGKSAHFIRPKSTAANSFGIRHYACDVAYSTPEWLEKNSDPLKEEAKTVMVENASSNGAVKTFYAGLLENADCTPSDGQARKRTSVSSRFRQQLVALRSELESTETHFIRCIKPNMEAKPQVLDNYHVSMQLESAGVLQTITVKRQGYPARRELSAFAKFFHSLAPISKIRPLLKQQRYADASKLILDLYVRVFGWKPPHYAVGNTKVFMKSHIWGALEKTLLRRNRMRMRRCVPLLTKWARRFRARKEEEARRKREAAVQQQRANVDIGTEKFSWFEELCRVFPKMDATIVYDVVGHLGTKQAAVHALSEMRAAQFDQHVPANMMVLLQRAHVNDSVIQRLIAQGIDNLEKLYALTSARMEEIGLTAVEQRHVGEVIVQQSSLAVRNQCLLVSGTGELPPVSDEQLRKLANAEVESRTVRDRVHELAAIAGCAPELAARALKAANGNESIAASMIFDGTVPAAGAAAPPPPQPASSAAPTLSGAPTRVVPTSRPPAPTTRPREAGPSGPPPGPPGGAPPIAPGFDASWEPALRRLTSELGFDRAASIDALRRSSGDFRTAAAYLAGAL